VVRVTGLRYSVRLNQVYFRIAGNDQLLEKEEVLAEMAELRSNLTRMEEEFNSVRAAVRALDTYHFLLAFSCQS
jgi:hypothetical protein